MQKKIKNKFSLLHDNWFVARIDENRSIDLLFLDNGLAEIRVVEFANDGYLNDYIYEVGGWEVLDFWEKFNEKTSTRTLELEI